MLCTLLFNPSTNFNGGKISKWQTEGVSLGFTGNSESESFEGNGWCKVPKLRQLYC